MGWKNDTVPIFEIYNTSKGYPIKDVNTGQNCMYLDSKGIIWVGTGDDKTGLVRFDYSAVRRDTVPPKVVIQSLKVDEDGICWYVLGQKLSNLAQAGAQADLTTLRDTTHTTTTTTPTHTTTTTTDSATLSQQEIMTYGKMLTEAERAAIRQKYAEVKFASISPFYPLPDSLVLPYEHNTVTFEYLAIEPAKPYLIQYQYRLEGYHKKGEWSPITSKTDVTFGNLDPGEYTFMVKATTVGATLAGHGQKLSNLAQAGAQADLTTLRSTPNSAKIAPTITEYTFTVSPPYYQSLWFYGMEVAVLLLGVCIVLWYRTRNVLYSVRLSLFIVSVSTFISFEYFQNFIENFLVQNIVLLTTVKLTLNVLIGISYIWLEAGFFKIMGLTGAKMQIDKRRLFKKNIFSVEKVAMKGDLIQEWEKGKKEGKGIIVKNMKLKGMEDSTISEHTGLSIDEIQKLLLIQD